MEVDFVSEVDRKFFANNLLSNEDLESTMDLTDIISFDSTLTTEEFVNNLPDELQLPFDEEDFSYFSTVKQQDLINEWSDSSDSGVSGLLGGVPSPDGVKSEPLSPVSSHSDSGDSAISQVNDPCHTVYLTDAVKQETSQIRSHDFIDFTQQPSQNVIYSVKHEDQKPVLSPVREDPVKLQSILNSKIKIQPKPDTGTHSKTVPSSTTVLSSSSSPSLACPSGNISQQKSLVLTAEEFARLTNQGVLRFDPPKQESTVQPHIIPSVTKTSVSPCASQPPVTSSVPVYSSHILNIDDNDVKIMKRQQRMIKNRESASLSRSRKKEYLSSLESRLQQYNSENERLKEENNSLKRKLDQLVSENESLKKKATFTPVKKTALLAVIFMLSLNLAPWSSIFLSERSGIKNQPSQPRGHTGRQLMSVKEEPEYGWENPDFFHKLHSLMLEYGGAEDKKDNMTDLPLFWNMCPTYFNKTESIRLAEQLAGWMSRHQEQKKVEKKRERRQKDKQLRPLSTLKKAMRGDLSNDKQFRSQDTRYQVQVFGGADTGRDFLKSIHRRNDTFYVLSFDTDYWLVPAVAHNKTMRPRMSLVMPALALNESMAPPPGRVGMMQIDCEVMNTQLIHVQKSAIPKKERENNTQSNFDQDQYYP